MGKGYDSERLNKRDHKWNDRLAKAANKGGKGLGAILSILLGFFIKNRFFGNNRPGGNA